MRILDLFAGAGAASVGYRRAGFEVVGVDIEPQPNFPGPFIVHDALTLDMRFLRSFDAIHASPPCQHATALRHAPGGKVHANLIPPTRALLQAAGRPYVIENVVGAELVDPIMLCGSHFGLGTHVGAADDTRFFQLQRHRLFECSFPVPQPACQHSEPVIGVYGGHVRCRASAHGGRGTRDFVGEDKKALARQAMGVDWRCTFDEISQMIPPDYCAYIGTWLRDHIIERMMNHAAE